MAVALLAAVPSQPKPNVVIAVSGEGSITITKDGKRITCGQLRALFQQEKKSRRPSFNCKALKSKPVPIDLDSIDPLPSSN
jgi:hypothetical protein